MKCTLIGSGEIFTGDAARTLVDVGMGIEIVPEAEPEIPEAEPEPKKKTGKK